jgi:hypothetical protein
LSSSPTLHSCLICVPYLTPFPLTLTFPHSIPPWSWLTPTMFLVSHQVLRPPL